MSYYKRIRNQHVPYYGYTYKSKSQQEFGYSLVYPMKQHLLDLEDSKKKNLLDAYREKYGESAYQYAIKVFPQWQHRMVEPSKQTLLRMIGILPPLLSTEQRIGLLKTLMKNEWIPRVKKISESVDADRVSRSVTTDWTNYKQDLVRLAYGIQLESRMYRIEIDDLPDYVARRLNWLFSGDMQIAEEIILREARANYDARFKDAYNTVVSFISKCDRLSCTSQVYSVISLSISTPVCKYQVSIKANKKTFFQRLLDLF